MGKKNLKVFVSKNLIRFFFNKKYEHKTINKPLKIYSRSSNILKNLKSNFYLIHKGNIFKKLSILKYFKGYKSGEFAFTRKPFYFPKKEVKKTTKKKK